MGLFDKYLTTPEPTEDKQFFGIGESKEKEKKGKVYEDEENQDDYGSLQDKKLKADTKKVDISNEKELNNLVERPMVKSFFSEIEQSIIMNFVNFARINSPELAAIMEIPEKEIKINEFLSDRIGLSLENVKKVIEKMNDDKMFL